MHQKVKTTEIFRDNLGNLTTAEPQKFFGGGTSTDEEYTTWEIKVCPECGREVKEFYSATVIKKGRL
jgi:hypothetical protein